MGFVQMTVQWLMFQIMYIQYFTHMLMVFFSFVLYFKMYPDHLKYSSNPATPIQISDHWRLSLQIKSIVKIYSFILICLIFTLGLVKGFPSGITTAIAWVLGILSMILSVLQFIPQIHQTFKHKVKPEWQYMDSISIVSLSLYLTIIRKLARWVFLQW